MQNLQSIKQRFGIIGNNLKLNHSLEKAIQVSPTDISVLVIGESGVGKEFIPKIIHSLSKRKHESYIAVNCGAIPEGTIDSELFGHEKGAFTGATQNRKGYFEVADGGTIFLDEVGELPLSTQVKLLRVLESGEFIKVGSSKIEKTNVRIIAATNVNVMESVQKGKFRKDLYYRLNTVQIDIPSLKERPDDTHLLFRKFSADFSEKYNMPPLSLSADAISYLMNFNWPGNIRQLRNLAEQISVVEKDRFIDLNKIKMYLPFQQNSSPALLAQNNKEQSDFSNEREILYKVLFDMKKDINDLKSLTLELINNSNNLNLNENNQQLIKNVFSNFEPKENSVNPNSQLIPINKNPENLPAIPNNNMILPENHFFEDSQVSEESLSIHEKEIELIRKALEKNNGKRKVAAKELGISERTLYRKIKQYNLQ